MPHSGRRAAMSLLGVTLAVPAIAHSGDTFAFLSAQKLRDKLDGIYGEQAIATGYIEGAADAMFEDGILCPPTDLRLAQLIALVKNYLNAHPEEWNLSGEGVVREALWQHYPCKRAK